MASQAAQRPVGDRGRVLSKKFGADFPSDFVGATQKPPPLPSGLNQSSIEHDALPDGSLDSPTWPGVVRGNGISASLGGGGTTTYADDEPDLNGSAIIDARGMSISGPAGNGAGDAKKKVDAAIAPFADDFSGNAPDPFPPPMNPTISSLTSQKRPLNHFSSTPALPKVRHPNPSLYPTPGSSPQQVPYSRERAGSKESITPSEMGRSDGAAEDPTKDLTKKKGILSGIAAFGKRKASSAQHRIGSDAASLRNGSRSGSSTASPEMPLPSSRGGSSGLSLPPIQPKTSLSSSGLSPQVSRTGSAVPSAPSGGRSSSNARSSGSSVPTYAAKRTSSPERSPNVKVGYRPTASRQDSLQPISTSTSKEPTTFSNPFADVTGGRSQISPWVSDGLPHSPFSPGSNSKAPSVTHSEGSVSNYSSKPPKIAPKIAPKVGGPATKAAPIAPAGSIQGGWIAPESWGVEGDEVEDESDEDSVEDNVVDVLIPKKSSQVDPISPATPGSNQVGESQENGKHDGPAPFGSSSARPRSKRPATSGSQTGGDRGPMNKLRLYKPDGTYSIISCGRYATASEVLSILLAKTFMSKTTNKIFIREKSSDRPLDAKEQPADIQRRRLIQAGYEDSDQLGEVGRDDLSLLCRFIVKPTKMLADQHEENSIEQWEWIDLSGRDLQVFPIFLHRHAPTIVSLTLSKNPFSEIPSDFIELGTQLKELRMAYMALKRVPLSISKSASLGRIDVSCNRIKELDSASLDKIPQLMSLKIQNNRLTTLPTYFSQLKFLKYLNISNNLFESFPEVLCDMTALVDLDFSFNAITSLPDKISQLANLERLVMVGNLITALPDTFGGLVSLRELDCRRNKVVDFTVAYTLPKLEFLKAEKNEAQMVDALFGPKMLEMNLAHNAISRLTLPAVSLGSGVQYNLTVLNLSHARLASIPDDALAQLTKLTRLNLNYNQFGRLPASIEKLLSLVELTCTDNLITNFPESIAKLTKLEIINVHNNNLQDLPEGIWQCQSLHTLNASSNLLESFPTPPAALAEVARDSAEELRKMSVGSAGIAPSGKQGHPLALGLRKLFLADNRLDEDCFHPISLLTELRVLNLSFNEIIDIPSWRLYKNKELTELYLSGNKLTSLPAEDLERLTNLAVLHLNGNKLQTLPAEIAKISKLLVLDVGSNVLKYNVNNWPYDWNWTYNTELRFLNLSGNKRLEIKPGEKVTGDGEFYATHRSQNLADFGSLSQLRVLGLMDVTLLIPLPEEGDDRRVRTSFSEVNNMSYGIADTLGRLDHLAMVDLVVPSFRGKDNECLFGMFGRATPQVMTAKVPKFVQEWFAQTFQEELEALKPSEAISDAFRRTFLSLNKQCYENIVTGGAVRKGSAVSGHAPVPYTSPLPSGAQNQLLRSGASGVVAYFKEKTLYVANAGAALAVVSKKGSAELLSCNHEPFDRQETARIRSAEGYITPRGLVNDDLDMSRGFGYYHLLPAVNAQPFVSSWQLSESDEFIIIANKALWDLISYQTAVDIARTEKDDPMLAAQKLRDFALSYGCEGSAMIMVIAVGDLFNQRLNKTRQQAVEDPDNEGFHSGPAQRFERRAKGNPVVGDRTLARLDKEIPPPVGLVALVFTDIVNSTSLWETNPGMHTAIRIHNTLLRRQLRVIGGYEVKTEGDAFMVSFSTVAAAMLWAFTCQLELLNQDWPVEILECDDGREVISKNGQRIKRGLSVRMGIHFGTPVCEKDPITKRMDYFGPMVNRSARINGAADGGQIMVSADVVKEIQTLYDSLEAKVEAQEKALDQDSLDEDGNRIDNEETDSDPHVIALRKLGFGIYLVGEKKLKGLESPERLSMVYPTAVSDRLLVNAGGSAAPQIFEPKKGIVSVEDVRRLAGIAIRLELLSSVSYKASKEAKENKRESSRYFATDPETLLPPIRDDMPDEQLLSLLESFSVRVENALSTMYLKHLGEFSSVMAALSQGLEMDPRMLIHAIGLFGNILNAAPAAPQIQQ